MQEAIRKGNNKGGLVSFMNSLGGGGASSASKIPNRIETTHTLLTARGENKCMFKL
jgi:hypothetical protein